MTLPYDYVPKKLTIDGNTLSYLDEGDGPVIIMVHGNPTWSYFYRNLVEQLKDRYRVIVPDHIGCGLSDKPQNYSYTLENHIDSLSRLISHLKISEASLVVHDWGGAIGCGFAVRSQITVTSIVVLNTAAFPMNRIPLRIAVCRIPFLGEFLVRRMNIFAGMAVQMAVENPLSDETASGFLYPYDSWENRVAVHRFILDIPMDSRHQSWKTLLDIESKLQMFTEIPMMIVWGGKDFCFNDLFYNEWKKRFPHAEYHYFDKAGHYVLEDAKEESLALIDTFFSQKVGNV